MSKTKIPLLLQVKDSFTGFLVIVTARCEYFTGCVLYEVIPKQLKDGVPQKELWIDETRLIIIKPRGKSVTKTAPKQHRRPRGGPRAAPHRRSMPE